MDGTDQIHPYAHGNRLVKVTIVREEVNSEFCVDVIISDRLMSQRSGVQFQMKGWWHEQDGWK